MRERKKETNRQRREKDKRERLREREGGIVLGRFCAFDVLSSQ